MRFHWLFQLSTWIEQTALSQFIQTTTWIVPAVQTVHILAIAAVLASATMIAGRFAGWAGRDQPPRRFVARYLPFIWWPLLALLATGIVMIIGEPARELANWVFQLKMAMLICAIFATRTLQRRLENGATEPSSRASGPMRTLSLVALALWVGIILAGRWIAYI